jgi:hypothetical protein
LLRSKTTRQRRFIRPASLAALSFLLVRRGIAGIYRLPCPESNQCGRGRTPCREFLKFGAKVHEGGDWQQPFEQVERVK